MEVGKMSLNEIKENAENLENKSKDELIRYVHEMLTYYKRIENRIISYRSDVKYYQRHLKKIKDMIDKIEQTKNMDSNRKI